MEPAVIFHSVRGQGSAILPAIARNPNHMSRIVLVEYDPCWPSLFKERASAIAMLLSPFTREIHHIGSTAVPGLAAKPKIDIDVVVSDLRILPELTARLRSTGYTFHGDPHAGDLWTFRRCAPLRHAPLSVRERQPRPCGAPPLPRPVA